MTEIDSKVCGVGILGFGTVGSGVYDVICTNTDILSRKSGTKIEVLRVLDLRDFPDHEVKAILTHNFEDILKDSRISIVAEVMGGIEPAFTFTKELILSGKSVVTSNKALVAEHGPELLELAKKQGVSYLFEASVGGGIPIIRPLSVSLTADEILEVSGILNGTTNYILSQMTARGKAFDEVLKTAQELGYAEADPTADVEGHDACRKIAILSSLAFGSTVDFNEIYTEGITKITDTDIAYAKKLGCVIKLIGSSRRTAAGISAKVAPMLISKEHPLASVNDAYNAIFVRGNMSGNTMYYGSGAGKLPTASAVVVDIVDVVRNMGTTVSIDWNTKQKLDVEPLEHVNATALIRIGFGDKEEAKASCRKIFGEAEFIEIGQSDEFALIINNSTEGKLAENREKIKGEKGVTEVHSLIRMEA